MLARVPTIQWIRCRVPFAMHALNSLPKDSSTFRYKPQAISLHQFATHHDTRPIAKSHPLSHDIGGNISSYAPINTSDATLQDWEINCHALFASLAMEKIVSTDELRRAIESLTFAQYEKWGYYEKWSAGMTMLLLERGVVTRDELDGALFGKSSKNINSPEGRPPRFDTGDYVRVRSYREDDSIEWKRPHVRVPGYIYGVRGVVERVCDLHDIRPSWRLG